VHAQHHEAFRQADVGKRIRRIQIDRLPEQRNRRTHAVGVALRPVVPSLHVRVVRVEACGAVHVTPLRARSFAFLFRRRANESIAAPRDRGDVARLGGVIAERASEHEDALRQVRVLDDGVGPHAGYQIVFFDRSAAMFEQDVEDIECLRRHRDRLPVA